MNEDEQRLQIHLVHLLTQLDMLGAGMTFDEFDALYKDRGMTDEEVEEYLIVRLADAKEEAFRPRGTPTYERLPSDPSRRED